MKRIPKTKSGYESFPLNYSYLNWIRKRESVYSEEAFVASLQKKLLWCRVGGWKRM